MVLLTAENIRKSYGTRVIFDDISFSIHEGDKIGVIGVNGTGKSTSQGWIRRTAARSSP